MALKNQLPSREHGGRKRWKINKEERVGTGWLGCGNKRRQSLRGLTQLKLTSAHASRPRVWRCRTGVHVQVAQAAGLSIWHARTHYTEARARQNHTGCYTLLPGSDADHLCSFPSSKANHIQISKVKSMEKYNPLLCKKY